MHACAHSVNIDWLSGWLAQIMAKKQQQVLWPSDSEFDDISISRWGARGCVCVGKCVCVCACGCGGV